MRILIADDDVVTQLSLKALLARHGHEVIAVSDGTQAWDILQQPNPPRLAILDGQMDRMDGVEVCRRVRAREDMRAVYLMLLTSRTDTSNLVAGLESGANDYVTKPFDPQELLARIRVGEQMVELQAQLADRIRELDRLTNTDALTGLANRRSFEALLDSECNRAARYGSPLALALLDIDHFKGINDTYGHQVGDEVLQAMGGVLAATARANDLVARFGGEEFAIILVNTELEHALVAAERFRAQVEAAEWPRQPITASFGVASWEPGTYTAAELISRADQALYHSKHSGRNRTTLWQDMPASATSSPHPSAS